MRLLTTNIKSFLLASCFIVVGCEQSTKTDSASDVTYEQSRVAVITLADDYLTAIKARNPYIGYYQNYTMDHHDAVFDNSLSAVSDWQVKEDGFLTRLSSVDYASLKGTAEGILYAQMQENLEADIGKRVCKKPLWTINHMGGFHSSIVRIAKYQPVGSEILRSQALDRWRKVGDYFTQETVNLRQGLEQGYSAPKVVVRRVIAQIDGLLTTPDDKSPLFDPVTRDTDESFKSDFSGVIKEKLLPAMQAYSQFLKDEYLPQARDSRSIAVNPNGAACYKALYRGYTSLKWPAQKVHDIGAETVKKYAEDVVRLGNEVYGLDDMGAILKRVNDDPENHFKTVAEMHGFFEAVVARVVAASPDTFAAMPKTQLDIKPYPDHLIGTGRSGSYERGGPDRNGIFRYDPTRLESTTKGSAEILSVHEGFPGHHMQIALVQDQTELHPIQRLFSYSAFTEGWARYSEALSEEMGVYQTIFAKISRRAWPARGMVTDTGMHVLGWSAEKTHEFLAASGRMQGQQGIDMMDRMAAIPAQLTSYDSGALEIFALRQQARDALGEKFDLKKFHTIVLKNGVVPLWLLREQVEEWIAAEQVL